MSSVLLKSQNRNYRDLRSFRIRARVLKASRRKSIKASRRKSIKSFKEKEYQSFKEKDYQSLRIGMALPRRTTSGHNLLIFSKPSFPLTPFFSIPSSITFAQND